MAVIRGGDKIKRALSEIGEKVRRAQSVNVGFLEGATYPDGKPVAMIAAIQEFGAPKVGIPPRPYFRGMVKQESPHWGADVAKVLKASDYDAGKTLGLMGQEIKGELQQSIRDLDGPPNSPVTNLLKQRFPMGGQTFQDVLAARRDVDAGVTAPAGKPLVQTGHMLNSVDYEVVQS